MSMICLALAAASLALAQQPMTMGDMESLTVVSAQDAGNWEPAEATMTQAAAPGLSGVSALRFHVEVDYNAGEKAYPVGWPRAYYPLKQPWQRTWGDYDYLRFSVYTETSRDTLPSNPLSLLIYAPDKGHQYTRNLSELKKGQWVDFEIPVWNIENPQEVTRLGVSLSESNYRDHDVVTFTIRDLCLVRHATPVVSQLTVRPSIAYADLPVLRVGFRALGIPTGKTAEAIVTVTSGDQVVTESREKISGGLNSLLANLQLVDLAEGTYKVTVKLAGGPGQEGSLKVVTSPWAR